MRIFLAPPAQPPREPSPTENHTTRRSSRTHSNVRRAIKIAARSRIWQEPRRGDGQTKGEQEVLFVTHQQLLSQSHPFYRAVNRILAEKMGRPGLAPGAYYRSSLLGFSRASTASAASRGEPPTR